METQLWKLKYFTMQKYTLQKILFKKNKPKSFKIYYYNFGTDSQVSTQAKISSFKSPHIKIDLDFDPYGPKSIKLLYTL
jgi:hypothetical protein